MSEKGRLAIGSGVIAVACLAAFYPVFRAGITNWDDPAYLAAAAHPERAFDTFVLGAYHPLTMLSLAVGRDPMALHAVNVVLHVIASILVLVFLWQLSGDVRGAAAGALLWSVHPLRVESVAWIVERKDVLCAVFYAGGLVAYMAHLRGRRRALAWTLVLFVLALLSKVMAISFPLALLTIDWLERRRAIAEKVPFFAASAVFGTVGLIGQRGAAMERLPGFAFPPLQKLLLACQAIMMYLERTLVPLNLSAFYPYPRAAGWSAAAIVAALALLSILAVRRSRAPAFALLFFGVTIVFTLPLISINWTVAADRFTYLPSIAFAYLIAVAVRALPRTAIAAAALAVVFIVATNIRSHVWHDSISLWTSVIDYTDASRLPFNSRAVALADLGRYAEARRDLDRALQIDPCYGQALRNRAILSVREGWLEAASADLARLTACSPNSADAWNMRGTVLLHLGRDAEARQCFAREAALRQRR